MKAIGAPEQIIVIGLDFLSPWTIEVMSITSNLQSQSYALPLIFTWAQGKEITMNTGMPSRKAQRFFGNLALFEKARKGS